jgi:hypothetical protein
VGSNKRAEIVGGDHWDSAFCRKYLHVIKLEAEHRSHLACPGGSIRIAVM